MFRERDAAARVARSVVEDEVIVGLDLAPVIEQQGHDVDLCWPRLVQAHVHLGGGKGSVLALCQVHALLRPPFNEVEPVCILPCVAGSAKDRRVIRSATRVPFAVPQDADNPAGTEPGGVI